MHACAQDVVRTHSCLLLLSVLSDSVRPCPRTRPLLQQSAPQYATVAARSRGNGTECVPSPLPLAPAFPCHLSRLRVVPEPSRVCLSSARPPLSPAQPHFLSPHPFGPVPISLFLGSLSSWAAYRPPPRRRHTRVFDGLAVGAWVCVCSGPYVLRAHCTPHGPILSVRVCSVSPVLRCLLLLPVAVFLVPFQRSFFLGSRRG